MVSSLFTISAILMGTHAAAGSSMLVTIIINALSCDTRLITERISFLCSERPLEPVYIKYNTLYLASLYRSQLKCIMLLIPLRIIRRLMFLLRTMAYKRCNLFQGS